MKSSIDPGTLRWKLLRFSEFEPDALYAVLQLRCEVFVVEQRCAYLDPDGLDRDLAAWHLLGRDADGGLIAYARLLPPDSAFAEASIGRVVTSPAARGSGLGHALMVQAVAHAARLWPMQPLRIGAQSHLVDFYAAHGFVVASDEYLEDGIPHREMLRAAA